MKSKITCKVKDREIRTFLENNPALAHAYEGTSDGNYLHHDLKEEMENKRHEQRYYESKKVNTKLQQLIYNIIRTMTLEAAKEWFGPSFVKYYATKVADFVYPPQEFSWSTGFLKHIFYEKTARERFIETVVTYHKPIIAIGGAIAITAAETVGPGVVPLISDAVMKAKEIVWSTENAALLQLPR